MPFHCIGCSDSSRNYILYSHHTEPCLSNVRASNDIHGTSNSTKPSTACCYKFANEYIIPHCFCYTVLFFFFTRNCHGTSLADTTACLLFVFNECGCRRARIGGCHLPFRRNCLSHIFSRKENSIIHRFICWSRTQ